MLSTGVRYKVSELGVKYNMLIYHAIDVKIAITRYEIMIAKYEATYEMYSHNETSCIKSRITVIRHVTMVTRH